MFCALLVEVRRACLGSTKKVGLRLEEDVRSGETTSLDWLDLACVFLYAEAKVLVVVRDYVRLTRRWHSMRIARRGSRVRHARVSGAEALDSMYILYRGS